MGREVILFGAGGHAKVVLESLLLADPAAAPLLLDDAAEPGATLLGRPVLAGRGEIERRGGAARVVPAIGSNEARAALLEWLESVGAEAVSVIDPRAAVSSSALIGRGVFIAPGAVVNAEARLGDGVILNTCASVDHDCTVGFAAHLAPGARLCGAVTVGPRTLVGAGATIIPGVQVGAHVVIGAGAVVVRDLADGMRVVGNPARPL